MTAALKVLKLSPRRSSTAANRCPSTATATAGPLLAAGGVAEEEAEELWRSRRERSGRRRVLAVRSMVGLSEVDVITIL